MDWRGKFNLILFGFLILVMIFCWLAFLRKVPTQETTGTITEKEFKEAGTATIYPYGSNRGFRTPTTVDTSAGYIFTIQTKDAGKVSYFANELAGQNIQVGQTAKVKYTVRGIPLIWKKVLVTSIELQ